MELKLICNREESEKILSDLVDNGIDDIANVLDIVGSLTRDYQERIFHGSFRYDSTTNLYRLILGEYKLPDARVNQFYRTKIPYGRFAVMVVDQDGWDVYSNMEDAIDHGFIPATDLPKYVTNNISADTFYQLMKNIETAVANKNFQQVVDETLSIKTHPDILLTTDIRIRLEHELVYLASNWQFDEIAHIMDLVRDIDGILEPSYKL